MTEKQSYFEFQDGKPVGINIYANNIAKKDFVYNVNKSLDFIEMLGDCLEAEEIVDKLNEQEERIKELEEKRKQLENLINKRIKYLKENNFELLERDKYTEIYILKWVLSIMNGDVE